MLIALSEYTNRGKDQHAQMLFWEWHFRTISGFELWLAAFQCFLLWVCHLLVCHPERSEGSWFLPIATGCRCISKTQDPSRCAGRQTQTYERKDDNPENPPGYLRTACATGSRTPASLANFAALSVASHVKSGSVRPKCPYAAVFL